MKLPSSTRRAEDAYQELKRRIQSRLDELKLTPLTAITAANILDLKKDAIRDIMVGRKRSLGAKGALIAQALKCDVAFLLLKQDYPTSQAVSNANITWGGIPIVGVAEEKALREAPYPDLRNLDQYPTIQAPANDQYPGADCYALRVVGNSMDAAKPIPLLDGMIALYVDMKSADLRAETGRLYVLKYSRDQGATWRLVIRRAKVFAKYVEFACESGAGAYPLLTCPDPSGPLIEIVGLVYQAIVNFS